MGEFRRIFHNRRVRRFGDGERAQAIEEEEGGGGRGMRGRPWEEDYIRGSGLLRPHYLSEVQGGRRAEGLAVQQQGAREDRGNKGVEMAAGVAKEGEIGGGASPFSLEEDRGRLNVPVSHTTASSHPGPDFESERKTSSSCAPLRPVRPETKGDAQHLRAGPSRRRIQAGQKTHCHCLRECHLHY